MSLLRIIFGNKTYLAKYESTIQSVKIGGRAYPITRIGNQLWLAENLDFKWDNLIIGSSGTSSSEMRANYYDNDEATYGIRGNKYGLLYNWASVDYLNTHKNELLPDGWHVPTTAEFDALATAVGGTSVAGTKLKSTTDWSSGAGTDDYVFSAFPAGLYDGNFKNIGSYVYFWTPVEYNSSRAYGIYFSTDSRMYFDNFNKVYRYCSVRLVKDAT